jgi:hypothetical protein
MKMRGSRLLGLMSVVLLLDCSMAIAAPDKDPQSEQRDAYIRSSMAQVKGIPEGAVVSSVDPLGDHRMGVYTVDGSRKDIWLVTTDDACPAPVLSGNKIVSLVPDGAPHDCRSIAIRPVDQKQLEARLFVLKPHRSPVILATDQAGLRWDMMFPPKVTKDDRTR